MSGVIAVFVLAIAILILWRMLKRSPATAEPPEIVGVREPLPIRPLNRSGAVALEEPDED
jgi:hypothetical protein